MIRLLAILLCVVAVTASVTEYPQCKCEFDKCNCVPFSLCINDRIVIDGRKMLNFRTFSNNPSNDGTRGECEPLTVCCPAPHAVAITEPPKPELPPSCGRRKGLGRSIGRILNPHKDRETEIGEFPWMAVILRKGHEGVRYFTCGGSLIGKRTVITAAHCVLSDSDNPLVVRLGTHDIKSKNEQNPYQEFEVSNVVIHPKFSDETAQNDIAVLWLAEDVMFTPIVSTICLPLSGETFLKEDCYVAGWGKTAFDNTGEYQSSLKKVFVPPVTKQVCEAKLRKTRLGPYFKLDKGFMCAGGEKGKDACKGDGGGPLMCSKGNVYKLAGIVSWGIECGKPNIPGVYTDVGQYVDWIVETANDLGEPELAFEEEVQNKNRR